MGAASGQAGWLIVLGPRQGVPWDEKITWRTEQAENAKRCIWLVVDLSG